MSMTFLFCMGFCLVKGWADTGFLPAARPSVLAGMNIESKNPAANIAALIMSFTGEKMKLLEKARAAG